MPPDQTPGVTGSLLPGDRDDVVITNWLTTMATGDEYGGAFVFAKGTGIEFGDGAEVGQGFQVIAVGAAVVIVESP